MERRNKTPTAARVVQVIAMVALVAVIFIDAWSDEYEAQFIVYGGLIGTILGADPSDLIEWFIGRRK